MENIAIQYTWNLLSQNDSVNKIAEGICKLHKEQNINNLQLKRLEKQRASALKASQNLISAIEQGIVTEQTKIRLKELEKQIMELDFDIEKEKQKKLFISTGIDYNKLKACHRMKKYRTLR